MKQYTYTGTAQTIFGAVSQRAFRVIDGIVTAPEADAVLWLDSGKVTAYAESSPEKEPEPEIPLVEDKPDTKVKSGSKVDKK